MGAEEKGDIREGERASVSKREGEAVPTWREANVISSHTVESELKFAGSGNVHFLKM